MSLTTFTAALAQGSAELSLALANLNFDVTLIKMEVPKAYGPVKTALSVRTKSEAEDGEIQACARKLQALFSPILPQIPSLHTAYGTRASEIATESRTEQTEAASLGPFADHAGIDGGSLWAAASSGQGAVAVHLLGCMLARMFTASEATSIWEELVATRKEEILKQENAGDTDPRNVFTVLAAKTPLTRQQLEGWDASARAWLRAADQAMEMKHKQLLLIINNISLKVNRYSSTYSDVTQAWIRAMIAVNKLIEGMPHSVVDGAILLAISAWHMYPDMMVLGKQNQLVEQKDDVFKAGGILTLGLETMPTEDPLPQGISWSLPLACYFYYGKPLLAEQSMIESGSRLTIDQLLVVTLGSLFSHWKEQYFEPTKAARLVRSIWGLVNRPSGLPVGSIPSPESWLAFLSKAANNLLDSQGNTSQEYRRLFKHGQRNCADFLGRGAGRNNPFRRLQDPEVTLPLMLHTGSRIKLLRLFATRLDIDPVNLIIRYSSISTRGAKVYGYATVASTLVEGKTQSFRRWESESISVSEKGEEIHKMRGEAVRPPSGIGDKDARFFWNDAPIELCPDGFTTATIDEFFGRFAEMAMFRGSADPAKPRKMTGIPYNFVFGDPSVAALYHAHGPSGAVPSRLTVDELETFASEGEIDVSPMLLHLAEFKPGSRGQMSPLLLALQAVATIALLYENFHKATIAMAFVRTCLPEAQWIKELDASVGDGKAENSTTDPHDANTWLPTAFSALPLSRPSMFASIAMLESGTINVGREGLDMVMALSSGDSLYVATELLNDPGQPAKRLITRITGNIGRPGISMLIPPSRTLNRSEVRDWRSVEHANFDLKKKDSFKGTSLHLSFTDYSLALDTGKRGVRSSEVQLLESVVSVHDKGHWIADVDILSALESPLLRRSTSECSHDADNPPWRTRTAANNYIAVDSWEEFLDRPKEDSVLRAHLNWQARLAACALSVARGDLAVILCSKTCWDCGACERERFVHKKKATFIM